MLLIADSGSSKCAWVVCDNRGKIILECKTIGFNPYFVSKDDIITNIESSELITHTLDIKNIFFYGAGCGTENKRQFIHDTLSLLFINSNIHVMHDIKGACYSMYKGNTNITSILGTGSNSCLFDGNDITEHAPALGYLIGDEASGNYFGRKVLNLYFNKLLPNELENKFKYQFDSDLSVIKDKIYNNTRANFYLASFFPFISENKDHEIIKNLIYNSLNEFFNLHIKCYNNYRNLELNFIGSVAYYLKEEIIEIVNSENLSLGEIEQNPIYNLVKYHIK
mgnify:CR=1 FL=1